MHLRQVQLLFLLSLALMWYSGCVESVPVDTKDKVPPKASLLASSQYSDPGVVTDDGQTVTVKCGENEPVALIASGFDPSGLRSVTLTAVSGGILLDERGARTPEITVEKDTTTDGKAVNRIIFPAKVEFDSPEQPLVLRVSSRDWAENTATTPVLRLQPYKMPVARISASAHVIDYGQSVTITYETENADRVFLNNQPMGTHNGTKTFPNMTATTLFTLRAEGVTGQATVTRNVFVNPKPNACIVTYFAANKTTLTVGETIRLSWKCSDCASLRIDPVNYSSNQTTQGYLDVTPNTTGTMIYTLTATGAGGATSTQGLSVNVNAPGDDIKCERTNSRGSVYSFNMTDSETIGENSSDPVTYSEWKMALNILVDNRKITSITNRSTATLTQPALYYNIRVGSGLYFLLAPGASTNFFNGRNLNSVYEVQVWNPGETPPAFIDIEICSE